MEHLTSTFIESTHSLPESTSIYSNFKLRLKNLFSIIRSESPILYWVTMIISLLGLVCILGILSDERTLMGVSVWLKPLKFSVSISIYLITVGYLITKYPYSRKKKAIINHITAWTLLLEFLVIFFQGSGGVQSHYNIATPLDGILFMFMGIFVGINVLTMVLFVVDTLRLKLKVAKSVQWAIFLGWLIVLFGSWVGGQMISQLSHSVAVPDGQEGLPLVNWSVNGGDLRVAHFFALHSIQIIPLFAMWVTKKWKHSQRKQLLIVTLFAFVFAMMIGYVFYQAKQGIPFIAS
ncbi:hypothetical protein NYZ99_05765 [Maribacter litopenaei]|uniref:Uncharacterized protein n=1 Tax=Maribacter litopenaei TaxID=2976127 RepID=A0ABY5YDE0_9FLAO|nr:hypothetical protein [Maribacter litopenaei]UWX55891.1 hypothetical protein NYZ99_05765 [Maribacter litopenaei]